MWYVHEFYLSMTHIFCMSSRSMNHAIDVQNKNISFKEKKNQQQFSCITWKWVLIVRVCLSVFCVVHLTSTSTFLIGSLRITCSYFSSLFVLWYMRIAVKPTNYNNLVAFLLIQLFVDKSLNLNCAIHSEEILCCWIWLLSNIIYENRYP